MNYAALTALVTDFVANTDTTFAADLPTLIDLAERGVYNDIKLPAALKNATATMTLHDEYLSMPSDYLFDVDLSVQTATGTAFLLKKDVGYIREAYPDRTYYNPPRFYAQYDVNTMILGPTPDLAYVTEMHYRGYPTSIVTANTTWLSTNYPQVLVDACVLRAYEYMKGDAELMAVYKAAYDMGLKQIAGYAGNIAQDPYR